MRLSPEPAVRQYEIRLYHSGDRCQPVRELGLFADEGEAVRVSAAVRLWLHIGVWSDSVFDRLPPDAPDELWALRQGFKADGTGPEAVDVRAEEFRDVVNSDGDPLDDDSDGDDSDIDTAPEPTTPEPVVVGASGAGDR